VPFDGKARVPGRYGGDLRMLMAKDRDIRHDGRVRVRAARRVQEKLEFVPDLLEASRNVRRPRLHVPPAPRHGVGRKPFTSEDFRYF